MNATVTAAVLRTPKHYWTSCLAQRAGTSPEKLGSFYPGLSSEDVAKAIQEAAWEPYEHPDVQAPARAFKAPLPGIFGLVRVDDLPDGTKFQLVDPKGTGICEAMALDVPKDYPLLHVDFSTLLVGPGDEGHEVVWSFFPGPPIRPSNLKAEPGQTITKAEAKALGFEWVKV